MRSAAGGGQSELDLGRNALETLDVRGAPSLARTPSGERLTSVVGKIGMPAGLVRTVMFTDIVDSTRLMSSAETPLGGGRASPHRPGGRRRGARS